MKEFNKTRPSQNIATGDHGESSHKTIVYPFDRFEIEVQVSSSGAFVGITGVKINKDFLTQAQRMAAIDAHDVDEYYREAAE